MIIERQWIAYRDKQMFRLLKHAVCAAVCMGKIVSSKGQNLCFNEDFHFAQNGPRLW